MTPFQTCKELYKDEQKFWKDVRSFLEYGHVLGWGERFFGLAALVNKDDKSLSLGKSVDATDAWYVHLFSGDMLPFIEELQKRARKEWIVFYRLKNYEYGEKKVYKFDDLKRRIA